MFSEIVLRVLDKKIQGHREDLSLCVLRALKQYVEIGYKLSDIGWFKNLYLERFEGEEGKTVA